MNRFRSSLLRFKLLAVLVLMFIYVDSVNCQTLKILPLGNSITQSFPDQYSYRYYLWVKLLDEGIDFDYVGTLTDNIGGSPNWPMHMGQNFDQDHEGHVGYKANDLAFGLPLWMLFYDPPDIALLHIGTNDVRDDESNESTIQDIKDIITVLRDDNPNVIILLAQIVPTTITNDDALFRELNEMIPSIAFDMYDANSPIYIVDQYNAINTSTDLRDFLHPNDSGEEKMAQRWFHAIKKALAGQENGLWSGNVSPDWSNAANWLNGSIPTDSTDVFIPSTLSGIYHPIANTSSNAVCDNLTISTGAQLIVPSGNTLTVNGDLYNFSGTSGLTIQSDGSGTGSLIHNTSDVEATVERHLTDLQWHLIGSPVINGNTSVFDLPSGYSEIYLRTHIEATNSWGPYIESSGTPLVDGRGYMCWVGNETGFHQDETIEFTGVLNAGNKETGTDDFYELEYTTGHGLNLLSNPYPSALLANINLWESANIANSVWVWSEDAGNYLYWNGIENPDGSGYGTLTNGVIPTMQGFFVLATGVNPSLTLPQSDRTHSNQVFYKSTGLKNTLSIKAKGNDYYDAVFIRFSEEASKEYDPDYDVLKIFGLKNAPQIYTSANELLSLNNLPFPTHSEVINLHFECGVADTYNFSFVGYTSFSDAYKIVLEDLISDVYIDLKNNSSYSFFHNPDYSSSRFRLHFIKSSTADSFSEKDISVYSVGNSVFIENPKLATYGFEIFNLNGQLIYEADNVSRFNNEIELPSRSSVYIIKLQTDLNSISQKVFIK